MKKIYLSIAAICLSLQIMAQAPQKMSYQAVIRNTSGVLVTNAPVGIQIKLYAGPTSGAPVYTETHTATTNANGLATIEIGAFTSLNGIDWSSGFYMLETLIDPTGGTNYTVIGSSQLLSVPYALYAETSGSSTPGPQGAQGPIGPVGPVGPAGPDSQTLTLVGQTLSISGGNSVTLPTGGTGVTLDQAYDQGGAGLGRIITADAGPVQINGSGTNTAALGIVFTGTGNSINAANTNAANPFAVLQGVTNSSTTNNSAVYGQSTGAARGITGEVTATATGDAAVRGNNLRTIGGIGVEGVGFNGVSGQTNYREGYGVFGQNYDLTGPVTANSVGVGGVGYIGVLGQSNDIVNGAGLASLDNAIILGDLVVSGTKNFRIDHPKDPANKYLNHFSIESNEVLNIYRGTVAFDSLGNASVQLPNWFDAVNKNASYQLTPIGGYAPIFIAEKIKDGRFVISGGMQGMEVSWVVYAERNDPYLQQHPEAREVEVNKSEREAGKYLRPDLYNQSSENAILKAIDSKETIQR
jgi:hypothetical protein